ncbi:ATP-dependent DNA helicase chl1 [Serendipita sp. 407]|nr:ATP-dependent DNA helicase chl1 [Serendipita sp. 407]
MALALPTPDAFPIFPYSTPYKIQLDLMRHLFSAIEERKMAIVESPTGTGKTLSLLSASVTWLNDEKERALKGRFIQLEESYAQDKTPDWLVKQSVEFAKRRLLLEEEEFQTRLDQARKREETMRNEQKSRLYKRQRVDTAMNSEDNDEDDEYLPEDEEDSNLSAEVRELMQRLEKSRRRDDSRTELEEPTCTKIYYASRTHSQLSQLQVEFEKLNRLSEQASDRPVARVVPLGSRKNLCINEELRAKEGDLDEGCRELMKEKGKKRCPYLPPPEDVTQMQNLRDQILATPRDIEDLVQLGKETKTCPYYGSRRAIRQAELVCLPYNLLLQKQSREALGVDVKDQVVVIDEAHNLIDTILNFVFTCNVFAKKVLTPAHALHLRRLVEFLVAVDRYCDQLVANASTSKTNSEKLMTPGEFFASLGEKVQGVNLLEIETYLRSSKIARKISGYCSKLDEKEKIASGERYLGQRNPNPPLHLVQNWIITLTNANEDGKIVASVSTPKDSGPIITLKYQLLNPSRIFRDIIEDARSVVLAGGTMAPMSDFYSQLVPYLADEKIALFSCGHVMPEENLKTIVVTRGPTGASLVYKHQQQRDLSVMSELGQILSNLVNIVPDGLVVFFPSYAFLNALRTKWKETGLLDKLALKKTVFFEPQESGGVDNVLQEYTTAIRRKTNDRKRGALLLAVVGAKLSEGLNFSDELARAVVIVGLPFANVGSVELQERMRYVKELDQKTAAADGKTPTKDAGMELYENICMKAVNQSIGRAIRHQNDWAALILLDERYGSARIRSKLPKWIGDGVSTPDGFGHVVKELAQFYRAHKVTA